MFSDEIKKSQSGDKNALNFLLNKYRQNAFAIACKFVQDKENAEDIVQEAFIKVFLHIKQFKNESAFTTWLFKIVYNESLKHISKNKKINLINEDVEKEEIINSNNTTDEKKQIINQSLQELTPNEYLIIQLFYWEEKSIKEISLITNQTAANIKVLLYRARKKIETFIEGKQNF